jgi:hypothetical protein
MGASGLAHTRTMAIKTTAMTTAAMIMSARLRVFSFMDHTHGKLNEAALI